MNEAPLAARIALSGRNAWFGLALLAASLALLAWNESRSAATHRALDIGGREVRVVDAARPDPTNEDRLVFVRGLAVAPQPIVDSETGIALPALAAIRKVETYQWREQSPSRRGVSGQTMETVGITLAKVWAERPEPTTVYMQARGLENPPPPFGDRRMTAAGASLGGFALSEEAIAALPTAPHVLDPTDAPGAALAGRPLARRGEWLIASRTPNAPEIGDVRVSYRIAPAGDISLAARQSAGRLVAHREAETGETILIAARGLATPEDLFGGAHAGATFMTWALRFVGALLMMWGFALLLAPLAAVADLLPVVGPLVAAGTKGAAALLTLLVAPLVVAGGWLLARPSALLALAAAAGALVWLSRRRARRPEAPPPASPRPEPPARTPTVSGPPRPPRL
ncbi:MAG: hypothetical protein IPL88_09190 [Rhizobiales bacterium]|nr:hypothetical protein [Hyphomicrobiales bacterium]